MATIPRVNGTTAQRGYGTEHQRKRAEAAALVAAGLATCWRCGGPIPPGSDWDLGHDDVDRRITRGPEHRHRTKNCIGNRAAGARKGNTSRSKRPKIFNSQRW